MTDYDHRGAILKPKQRIRDERLADSLTLAD